MLIVAASAERHQAVIEVPASKCTVPFVIPAINNALGNWRLHVHTDIHLTARGASSLNED